MASFPSSYIPTYGATATRPADTLTVPSANLPVYQAVDGMRALRKPFGSELVTNGTFDSGTTGWSVGNSNGSNTTLASTSSQLVVTSSTADGNGHWAQQSFATVVGKAYVVSAEYVGQSNTSVRLFRVGGVSITTSTGVIASSVNPAVGTFSLTFVATATTTYVAAGHGHSSSPATSTWDNISVRLADEDRSSNAKGLATYGTVTRSAVATGSEVVAYSGFSASNYLEQPYNSDLDFGTGDFCVMGWVKPSTTAAQNILSITDKAGASFGTNGHIVLRHVGGWGCAAYTGSISSSSVATLGWQHLCILRSSGVISLYVDGALIGTANNTANLGATNGSSVLTVGTAFYNSGPSGGFGGSLALLRISATAPTAEQIAEIYAKEAPLFEAGATLDDMETDAVSVAMEGLMTYADVNGYNTVVGVEWIKDSSNYIRTLDVSTNSTDTGRPFFAQRSVAVTDTVASTGSPFSPGVNVPFNIASRHGTNFINGAVNGTVLTADTTPTSLPNLSATNLTLGHTFNGYISKFRVWGDDIGDDGLLDVTS